ncbi:MAG: UDP-N-acetylmuramoyl-tripeptide--D-alanyl-D-alanine ligase [Chitinophagales bacterium]|nr:UDP-N-acetylmuramoyl-tripeptide--D-alanyl-D-alanine ligase [Chitinophagales bacterium]
MGIGEIYQLFLKSEGVQTDTRKLVKGEIYWALKGENFDGNTFAQKALEQGASYAVIDDKKYLSDERIILVENTLMALQTLANHHRRQFDIPVIGITGSNGKTTTKELVQAVLKQKYQVLATVGNLNNHFGVPLTLLKLTPRHEIAIIEMGANHLGEITHLCSIAEPNFGLITSIGRAHIGEFGGFEAIKTAKSELYEWLQGHGGTVFINQDYPILKEIADKRNVSKRINYGSDLSNHYTYSFLSSHPFVKLNFNHSEVKTQIPGEHNYNNIIAAASVGQYFGVPKNEIIAAIQNYQPNNNRSQIVQYKKGVIILDAYNANPSSMEVALCLLQEMKEDSKAAILGSMLELGKYSLEEHQKIVGLAESMGLKFLVLVGNEFKNTQRLPSTIQVEKVGDIKNWFQQQEISGTAVLIKGSRANRLEDIIS